MRSTLIGITGNSGCGQTTAASFLADLADGVCSLDRLGHRLIDKPYVRRIIGKTFGLDSAEEMESSELRKVLSGRVFSDPEELLKLNDIMHPRMRKWVFDSAGKLSGTGGIWILEGALIYELGLDGILDWVILIRDTEKRCMSRLAERDGIDGRQVTARWDGQLDMSEKVSRAQYVVENSAGLDYLKQQVLSIFHEISENGLNI
jgi:dephospho-CoA kinase